MLENCILETKKHINKVRKYLNLFIDDLVDRGVSHDASKLIEPELSGFAAVTEKLEKTSYGSKEYFDILKELEPILKHHYAENRHHSEHWLNGIEDMTLVDIMEMLADWKAATLRTKNGDIIKSIEINSERFKISPQLKQILLNTAREYFSE